MTIIINPANPKIKISSLNKGLVGHWPLDQESFNPATKRFTDKTPYSNHGTGHGTQLGSTTPGFQADYMGQLVRACPFNGTDDYIDCGNDPSLDISDTITVNVWAKASDENSLVLSNRPFSGNGWHIIFFEGKIMARCWGLSDITIEGNSINTNEWYHVVFTYDKDAGNDNYILYINGAVVSSETVTGSINYAGSGNLLIGKDAWNVLNGSINQIRIYNRVLSQQEITSLYESYRPKLGIG